MSHLLVLLRLIKINDTPNRNLVNQTKESESTTHTTSQWGLTQNRISFIFAELTDPAVVRELNMKEQIDLPYHGVDMCIQGLDAW